MYHRLISLQEIDWCLSPKFQGNVFGPRKKKDFCIVLAGKPQKRHGRAPLSWNINIFFISRVSICVWSYFFFLPIWGWELGRHFMTFILYISHQTCCEVVKGKSTLCKTYWNLSAILDIILNWSKVISVSLDKKPPSILTLSISNDPRGVIPTVD